jgi:hypothetical protein
MQITSINNRDGLWHVSFSEGDMIGSRIYSDPYEVFQFLIDSGFHMDRISYEFPGQSTEDVTIVGNKRLVPLPRGYRSPSLIDDYEVDIETVMGDIETFYKERNLGR